MFSRRPELAAKIEAHPHYFFVDDVQSLFARHKSAGADVVGDIGDKPWGVREYTVREINGYHLTFAGPQSYARPAIGADSLPPHVRMDKRVATLEEYIALRKSVNWSVDVSASVLERTLFGVVAVDTRENQTVGMLRVCGDGRYFTIWDVIVATACQGQKIGSGMMELAMSELRRIGPKGAFVGLFTPKPAFYERFGFAADQGGMHTRL
jgi:ribosomal protein S18 acetylase RimI-like enzyme